MVKSEPKKKSQSGGFFQKFFRKPEKSQKEQRLTVQRSIPYLEMGRDGICRVEEHLYSKTVRFYDINYQLAQNEDKNTIFESWCDFLNYFDATIDFFQHGTRLDAAAVEKGCNLVQVISDMGKLSCKISQFCNVGNDVVMNVKFFGYGLFPYINGNGIASLFSRT